MRFASFMFQGAPAWGLVSGDRMSICGGGESGSRFPTLLDALPGAGLSEALSARTYTDSAPLDEYAFLPVIPNAGKIFCIGLNYATHLAETGRPKNAYPPIFVRFADSQTGHRQAILRPAVSDQLDFEGELAVVIGRGGRAIAASDALDHVAGFSCYNDASVRDWQKHTTQFTPGKNFPGTGAFGPWLVTPDEFGELRTKRLQTRLNGEVMQSAMLGEMVFDVGQLIAYISTFTPLRSGDVIVTGTPGGVGSVRNPPVFMQAGDLIEVEIDGIGTLSNHVQCE